MIKIGTTGIGQVKLGTNKVTSIFSGLENVFYNIPARFRQVEYIYANRLSYIDTSLLPNQDTTAEINLKINSLSGNFIGVFGTETPRFSIYFNNLVTSSPKARFDYNNTLTTDVSAISKNDWHCFKIAKNKFYVDGIEIGEANYEPFTVARSLYLFTTHINNGAYQTPLIDVFVGQFKIFDNKTLILHYIPAFDTVTSLYGMYDLISDSFKASYTNNPFLGPNVV